MKTITFYSYKGGVGRSLALSNVAMQLSQFKKKVVVLDFDLEAPGLHFKFKKNFGKQLDKIDKGIVDYIYQFHQTHIPPETISDYAITLNPGNNIFAPIHFIPAGNIDSKEYWKKLSAISWADMFYKEGGNGVRFFLDLKAKIEKEFDPDFILIDSRTGITDIAGITLRLLADDVVVLAANNEENIFGSKKIINSLLDKSNILFDKIPKIYFVLTRIPMKDFSIVEKRKTEFSENLKLDNFNFLVIHTDSRLEINETLLIGESTNDDNLSTSKDYLDLFYKLTEGHLSKDEIEKFENKKKAKREYNKSQIEKDTSLKIQHLTKAIEFDNTLYEYYWMRGYYNEVEKKLSESLADYITALNLNPDNSILLNNIGNIFRKQEKLEEAMAFSNKSIIIDPNYIPAYKNKYYILSKQKDYKKGLETLNYILEKINPQDDATLNSRADLFRFLRDFKSAYSDIYKAIEINSENPVYYATLAEIYVSEERFEEFYINLDIALSKGLDAESLNTSKDVYIKLRNEPRLMKLMEKYNIDIDEIFEEEKI
jgi:tetratricopeptide (TPR) repeat protein